MALSKFADLGVVFEKALQNAFVEQSDKITKELIDEFEIRMNNEKGRLINETLIRATEMMDVEKYANRLIITVHQPNG